MTALILCQLIDEVEERIKYNYDDCLSTASGMAVKNTNFLVQEAIKNEELYPGATNEFHRVYYVVQEILKGKYQ